MSWLRLNWRRLALNLFGGAVLVILLSGGSRDLDAVDTFDPGLESGKWAIRFLLICLAMTPLQSYFGWRGAIQLRKPTGLWSFGFALLHVLFYIIGDIRLTWLASSIPLYIALGLLGLLILTALALTSNRWAMRRLGKYWKRLHRLVYLAGLIVVFHGMLATTASKKVLLRDPQAIQELRLYLGLLVVLLVVRVPQIRRALKQIPRLLQRRRQTEQPVTPVIIPDRLPEYRPKVNGHGAEVPSGDLPAEVHHAENVERVQTP
jgi:sulfoxide reductase heme-binding subunit YedZ